MSSEREVDYGKYENRLATFNFWPNESPDLIKELVDAGFYYNGESDVVKCFACSVEVGDWHDEDNPLARHESENAGCRHLAERASQLELQRRRSKSSSPSENPSGVRDVDDFGYDSVKSRAHSIKKFEATLSDEKVQAIALAGWFYNESVQFFECHRCHCQFDVPELLSSSDPFKLHLDTNQSCKYVATVLDDQKCNTKPSVKPKELPKNSKPSKSKNEQYPTEFNCPSDLPQQSEIPGSTKKSETKLRHKPMESGLKLKMPAPGNRRRAVDVNQGAKIENQGFSPETWYNHPSPIQAMQQIRFGPKTILTPSDFSGGNSPAFGISPRASAISEVSPFLPQISRQLSNHSISSDDDISGNEYQSNSPLQLSNRKLMLTTKYGRLQTFLTWPQDSPIQPQQLSEAGFYYVGEDDGVKCYVCGILLRNWESTDTAWGEHKKWSPQCPLVMEHDTKLATNDRLHSISENPPPIRRQFDRVVHNFYEVRMENPSHMQYQAILPSAPFWPNDSRYLGHLNVMPGMHGIGGNNIFQPPHNYSDQNFPGQQALSNQRFPNDEDRAGSETPETEQIGPLSKVDFDTLLDAGFPVETINNVQKLALEKYGKYFDSVESVADAIVYFLDNENLDGHSMPDKGNENEVTSGERNDAVSSKQVDLKRELDKVREMQLCKICMDEQVGAAFHPCGHLFTCPRCAEGLEQCPVCRANIESTSRVYLS